MSTQSTEQLLKDAMENMSSFNSRLLIDRKMRMPFLDAQTGMAQINCSLWAKSYDRGPGEGAGQLYTYQARRWRKKKRIPPPVVEQPQEDPSLLVTGEDDLHQISAVENPLAQKEVEDFSKEAVTVEKTVNKDYWYDDVENISEPPDAGEIDDYSDMSDYEESYRKKRKKATPKSSQGRKKKVYASRDKSMAAEEETEKPFPCELCSARYKTRPGLTYHYNHFHGGPLEETMQSASPKPSSDDALPANDKNSGPNDYCDFCLGDAAFNKKTKASEDLVSCADCGRSGHPTCLQFTENMIVSVKKYPWQCIECKSCLICRTSENDDQLLFCDDCDRGYHMYCLSPPLSEPPEGNWSCHLCIQEFHGGKKPLYMQK